MTSDSVVISISGGMDSGVLLFKALETKKRVHCLTFDYGQRHSIELEYLGRLLGDAREIALQRNVELIHKVLDVRYILDIAATSSLTNKDIATPDVRKMLGEAQPVSYVPNRNMMFLSICTAYAEANNIDVIHMGQALADSSAGYWDGTEEFISTANTMLSLNRAKKIRLEAPLIKMSKKDIILEGIRLGVDFSKCWTCYSGEYPADVYTPSSSLRIKGFLEAGYIDPMRYKQDLTEVYKKHNCINIPTK